MATILRPYRGEWCLDGSGTERRDALLRLDDNGGDPAGTLFQNRQYIAAFKGVDIRNGYADYEPHIHLDLQPRPVDGLAIPRHYLIPGNLSLSFEKLPDRRIEQERTTWYLSGAVFGTSGQHTNTCVLMCRSCGQEELVFIDSIQFADDPYQIVPTPVSFQECDEIDGSVARAFQSAIDQARRTHVACRAWKLCGPSVSIVADDQLVSKMVERRHQAVGGVPDQQSKSLRGISIGSM